MHSSKLIIRVVLLTLPLGIFVGWLWFGGSGGEPVQTTPSEHQHESAGVSSVWTCSMHPQIRKEGPGQCPLCGMDLIPVESEEDEEALSLSEIRMSKAAMKIAEIETVIVEKAAPYKEVYFPGKVKADERRIVHLTARFGGRIEKLFINFTGQKVKKDQKLVSIYSPHLVTAQKELFEAIKYKESRPAFYQAARNKLRLWDLTAAQIDEIEASGESKFYFDVVSPIDGTVTMRHVAQGHYVKEGEALLEVTDLSHLWVLFDTYESDLPWVKLGDRIDFTIKSLPSEDFRATVTFIDPVVDPVARVAYVRTELDNEADLLKPEMFARGVLKTMLPRIAEAITVPKSAVLWTGKRAIVYVKVPDKEMVFEHREIGLGEDAGAYYVVTDGLEVGEEIVVNGVFKVDAAAQLLGKQSMMTPAGGKSSLGGHAGMDMGGDSDSPSSGAETKEIKPEKLDPEFSSQFLAVIDGYLEIKNSLVADDAKGASNSAGPTLAALARVDMDLLHSDAQHMAWMQVADPIKTELEGIRAASEIERQRALFSTLSEQLLDAVKTLGIDLGKERELYLDFCPMAVGNAGAYWLSEQKEILNPYFGQAMLTCGEVTEDLGGAR